MEDIEKIVEKVVNRNTDLVIDFKRGNYEVLQKLITEVLKEAKGKVDPSKAKDILLKKIG